MTLLKWLGAGITGLVWLAWALVYVAFAQGPTVNPCIFSAPFQPSIKKFEQITVSTSAVRLSPPTSGALYAIVALDVTNGLRYRSDGTAPTAAIGTPIAGGSSFAVCASELTVIQMIRSGGADAVANVHYYGLP